MILMETPLRGVYAQRVAPQKEHLHSGKEECSQSKAVPVQDEHLTLPQSKNPSSRSPITTTAVNHWAIGLIYSICCRPPFVHSHRYISRRLHSYSISVANDPMSGYGACCNPRERNVFFSLPLPAETRIQRTTSCHWLHSNSPYDTVCGNRALLMP